MARKSKRKKNVKKYAVGGDMCVGPDRSDIVCGGWLRDIHPNHSVFSHGVLCLRRC